MAGLVCRGWRRAGNTGYARQARTVNPRVVHDDECRSVDVELGSEKHLREIGVVVASVDHDEDVLHVGRQAVAAGQPRVTGEGLRASRQHGTA